MPASEQGSSEQAPDGLQPLYRGSGGPLGSSFPRPGGSCPCGSFLLGITLLPQGWPVLLPTERWSVVSQFCWPSLPMGCISAACSTTGCFTMPLQQIFVVVSPSACASLSEQTEGYSRGIFTWNFFQAFAMWVVYTPLERAWKICHLYYKNRTLQMCQNPWFHQTDAVDGDGRVASCVKYVLRLYSEEEVHTYVLCTALEKSQWSQKKKKKRPLWGKKIAK